MLRALALTTTATGLLAFAVPPAGAETLPRELPPVVELRAAPGQQWLLGVRGAEGA
ncbi:MAG: hypothetical protein JWO90_467, partial [Solirubrobacterales bacterium]|nr:hypothetical protein [Solirubrobacterales bacterium]